MTCTAHVDDIAAPAAEDDDASAYSTCSQTAKQQ